MYIARERETYYCRNNCYHTVECCLTCCPQVKPIHSLRVPEHGLDRSGA